MLQAANTRIVKTIRRDQIASEMVPSEETYACYVYARLLFGSAREHAQTQATTNTQQRLDPSFDKEKGNMVREQDPHTHTHTMMIGS